MDSFGNYLYQWRIRTVMPHVRGKVLDIGCGENRLVPQCPNGSLGVDVVQWGNVDVVVQDSSKLPFADSQFDTVTLLACLNHIPNRQNVLLEAFRLLKRDGKLVVTMIPPGISAIWHKLRKPWDADQSARSQQAGEVYGLRQAMIRKLLIAAGFSILLEQTFMLGINVLTVGIKTADPLHESFP